jgi:hypothetical protein
MRAQSLTIFGLFAGAALFLASCAVNKGPDFPLQCQAEVKPQGSYEYAAGVTVPQVRPVGNGTAAGAAALNTCIRSKAAAAGISSAPVPITSATKQRYTLQSSGGRTKRGSFFGLFRPAQSAAGSDYRQSGARGVCRGGLEMLGGSGYYCNGGRYYAGD